MELYFNEEKFSLAIKFFLEDCWDFLVDFSPDFMQKSEERQHSHCLKSLQFGSFIQLDTFATSTRRLSHSLPSNVGIISSAAQHRAQLDIRIINI